MFPVFIHFATSSLLNGRDRESEGSLATRLVQLLRYPRRRRSLLFRAARLVQVPTCLVARTGDRRLATLARLTAHDAPPFGSVGGQFYGCPSLSLCPRHVFAQHDTTRHDTGPKGRRHQPPFQSIAMACNIPTYVERPPGIAPGNTNTGCAPNNKPYNNLRVTNTRLLVVPNRS